jgi:hypothetical protein
MKDTSINYTQLGFDSFGLSNIQGASPIPANLADYILEVAENSVSNKKIRSVSADKITAGTLVAVTNIGDESIKLDGEDHSIKIYDASNRLQIYIQGQ